mgnify:CR=1 FL=1
MTYAELVQKIRDYTEVSSTVLSDSIINGFINDAEWKIFRDVDSDNNKTRISVIYLNTLSTAEEKEFFVGSIAQLLYNWMLKNPPNNNLESLQCALFIDEIAPYIPPVKKPACKTSLELLFRQGRKYS